MLTLPRFSYLLLLIAAAFSTGANANTANARIDTLVGDAYALGSDTLIYQEHHKFSYNGDKLIGDEVEYRAPDGSVIGHKTLDFSRSLNIPTYKTSLYDDQYVEGLKYDGDNIVIFNRQGRDAEEKSKTLELKKEMAADAGFNSYVQQHFDELASGDKVKFLFVAANYLKAVNFKAQKIGERQVGNTPVIDFKVTIDSFFSLFIDPLIVSYDPQSKYLIEYQGLSNVRDADGELYKVRIRYPQFMRKPDTSE